jgi:integrase
MPVAIPQHHTVSAKSEKARAITLPAFALDELRRLKREQAEELSKLRVGQAGDSLIGARAHGEAMQRRSLTHELTRLAARIKDIPRICLHDLRHSHATQLLLAGRTSKGGPRASWSLNDQCDTRSLFASHGDDAAECCDQDRRGLSQC